MRAGFAPNCADEPRVRIAQRVYGDAAEEIQIRAAAVIVKCAAFAVGENKLGPLVCVRKIFIGVAQCGRLEETLLLERDFIRFGML